jgi:hypothetical protein
VTDLASENESLRAQLEAYRLRELEDLRSQLAEAKAQAAHYRAEAARNVEIGHQIAREAEAERGRLRERISVLEQSSSVRSPRTGH